MTESRSLRIAFRVGHFPTLSETFVLSQIDGMIARGHRVSVLADRMSGQEGACPLTDRPAARAATRYIEPRLPMLARLYAMLPYRLRRARAALAERRMCRDNDVVVCNFGWAGATVAASVGGRPRDARIVTIFHGDDMSRTLTQGEPDIYAGLFREGDMLAPVSAFWRRRLIELGAPEAKLVVHHMGVDLRKYPFTPREPAEGQPVELLTVGRLVEKKGAAFVLRALARLREASPALAFRLTIIGDGPLRSRLEDLRDQLGLVGSVDFAGALPHDSVAGRLAGAHVFVLPSVVATDGDMEGIPVSLMEAMASGVPVVSTWHSGIPELIEHGVSGLLAAERDVADLAHQLERMMTDGELRAACAQAARRTVEQRFNERLLNDRLEVMLRELSAGGHRAAAGREHSLGTA